MDLNSIASGYVSAVNPVTLCVLQPSTGYTTLANGKQVPSYGALQDLWCQLQALTYNDLHQVQGLNIQGTKLACHVEGNWNGVVRSDKKGGDLLTTPDGRVWLAVQVLEDWYLTGWTKLCLVLQDGS